MIAILGWGSLLWEKVPTFDDLHRGWNRNGPEVPLEFSRVSKKRSGALTLVIDPMFGTSTTVAWTKSKRTHVDDAVCDLRCREETQVHRIGKLVLAETVASELDEIRQSILVWAREQHLEAVVWTALPPNFKDKTQKDFSVEAAKKYLHDLPSEAKAKAAEYIWRAPAFVVTALRSEMQNQPWFTAPHDHP
jgi:hypothetical protein